MIVVDTNVIAHFFLRTDLSTQADRAMNKDPDWIVPQLWRSEFRNVLATRIRVQRISLERAIESMTAAEHLLRDREYDVSSSAVLDLSHRSQASAYDCEFIALAQKLAVPLVTLDRKLTLAFPETAITLEEWIGNDKR